MREQHALGLAERLDRETLRDARRRDHPEVELATQNSLPDALALVYLELDAHPWAGGAEAGQDWRQDVAGGGVGADGQAPRARGAQVAQRQGELVGLGQQALRHAIDFLP